MKAAEDETAGNRTGETTGLDESSNHTVTIVDLDPDYRALNKVEPLKRLVNP